MRETWRIPPAGAIWYKRQTLKKIKNTAVQGFVKALAFHSNILYYLSEYHFCQNKTDLTNVEEAVTVDFALLFVDGMVR